MNTPKEQVEAVLRYLDACAALPNEWNGREDAVYAHGREMGRRGAFKECRELIQEECEELLK